MDLVRLACVKRAASVHPEPGSNSPTKMCPTQTTTKVKVRAEAMKTVSSWAGYYKVMEPYNKVLGENTYFYSTKGEKSPKKLNLNKIFPRRY